MPVLLHLVINVILWVLRIVHQRRLHILDAELANLRQQALMADQELLRQRVEYEMALSSAERELGIAKVNSRRELRLKRCEARHALEGKTPKEVRRFLHEEGVL